MGDNQEVGKVRGDIAIVGARHTQAWQRRLFSSVFDSLYKGHYEIREDVEFPSKDVLDHVRVSDGHLHKMALTALASRKQFRRRVGSMYSTAPQTLGDACYSMMSCSLPLFYVKPDDSLYTCRQPWICPSCRFRQSADVYTRLKSVLHCGTTIGAMALFSWPGSNIPTPSDFHALNKLVHRIYHNKYNGWVADVVVPLVRVVNNTFVPVYIVFAIGAISDFQDLSSKLGVKTEWDTGEATEETLVALVSKFLRYQPDLLYDNVPANTLASTMLARVDNGVSICRMRTHGCLYNPGKLEVTSNVTDESHLKVVCNF
jgi:hypothetical protein